MKAIPGLTYYLGTLSVTEKRAWGILLGVIALGIVATTGLGIYLASEVSAAITAPAQVQKGEAGKMERATLGKDFFSARYAVIPVARSKAVEALPTEWVTLSSMKLGGTVSVGGRTKAIVNDSSGKTFYLSEGSRLNEFVVLRIEKLRVVCLRAEDAGLGETALENPRIQKHVIPAP
ncbi:MAG: hypothetical protein J0L75_08275 [Spirochaetes bacterium]|nr:hypothetical protein [Spirochaetota bacterium]